MIRQPIKKKWSTLLGVASVVAMLGLYTWMAHRQHVENPDDTSIPTWSQLKDGVAQAVKAQPANDRWIVADAKATFVRLMLGLSFGVLGALILGLLMGCLMQVEAFFIPPLTLLALIPPTAALAVYFVLVGTDTSMYVTMIALGTGATMARSTYLAVKEVPTELLYKAYTLGGTPTEIIWSVILPQILPKFIDTVRLHIAPAMIFLIAAEMVCGDVGFGYRIRLQSRLLNMNVVFPYLAVLAAFGFVMDYSFRTLQRRCCPWYQTEGGE